VYARKAPLEKEGRCLLMVDNRGTESRVINPATTRHFLFVIGRRRKMLPMVLFWVLAVGRWSKEIIVQRIDMFPDIMRKIIRSLTKTLWVKKASNQS